MRRCRRCWTTLAVQGVRTALPYSRRASATSPTPTRLTPPTPSTATTCATTLPLAPATSPAPPVSQRLIPVFHLLSFHFLRLFVNCHHSDGLYMMMTALRE